MAPAQRNRELGLLRMLPQPIYCPFLIKINISGASPGVLSTLLKKLRKALPAALNSRQWAGH